MKRGDEMAANIETGERQSAGAVAGSDDVCVSLMSGLRASLKDLERTCDLYFNEMPMHRAAQTKPKPVTPPSSRAPVPPYIPPHP
jgi:hypothetical protein